MSERPVSTLKSKVVWIPVELPPNVRIKSVIGYREDTDTLYELRICGLVRPADLPSLGLWRAVAASSNGRTPDFDSGKT